MKSLEELMKIRDEAAKKMSMRHQKDGYRIVVGMATCGITAGAREVLNALVETVAKRNLDINVVQVGCMGECALEPIVEIYDTKGNRTTYCKVTPQDAERIIDRHIVQGFVVDDLLLAKHKKVGDL